MGSKNRLADSDTGLKSGSARSAPEDLCTGWPKIALGPRAGRRGQGELTGFLVDLNGGMVAIDPDYLAHEFGISNKDLAIA